MQRARNEQVWWLEAETRRAQAFQNRFARFTNQTFKSLSEEEKVQALGSAEGVKASVLANRVIIPKRMQTALGLTPRTEDRTSGTKPYSTEHHLEAVDKLVSEGKLLPFAQTRYSSGSGGGSM